MQKFLGDACLQGYVGVKHWSWKTWELRISPIWTHRFRLHHTGVFFRYELARLVETLFPHQAHLPEFRPILATWLRWLCWLVVNGCMESWMVAVLVRIGWCFFDFHGLGVCRCSFFKQKHLNIRWHINDMNDPYVMKIDVFSPEICKSLLDVPLPTYPYGKSLYKPYIVSIYGLEFPRIPREHNKYHGCTVRGTPNCPLIYRNRMNGTPKLFQEGCYFGWLARFQVESLEAFHPMEI